MVCLPGKWHNKSLKYPQSFFTQCSKKRPPP